MGLPVLEPAHRLLVCLAVAARAHDPVLVAQVAEKAERTMSPKEMRRTFSRLDVYGVSGPDLDWLQTADR
jgi:hypothetical protein